MNREPELADEAAEDQGSLLTLTLLSLITGTATRLLVAVFRLILERADRLRDALVVWAHGWTVGGVMLVIGVPAAAAGLAAWLVRRFSPQASGSGIPHVEAVLTGRMAPAPFRLIPVKFCGGLLAIGGGLALGREGPSVQMGASRSRSARSPGRGRWP